jgi:nitrogen-specific signal transduction histidine kinase
MLKPKQCMDETSRMQDSGLALSRLLAGFLHVGVLLVDEAGICRFANADACELLDAADEAAAREQWSKLQTQIDVRAPHAAPVLRTLDLATDRGVRRLRVEAHALRDTSVCAVLLRDRAAIGEADFLPLLATRAQSSRALLAGLVHGASGPLNNLNLTLAILDAGIEPSDGTQAAAASARLRRHLGVLRSEAASLGKRLDELRALADRRPHDPIRFDVAASVQDVARWLRHEAVVREAAIHADASSPVWIAADRDAMTLALVALASRLLDACGPGSVMRLSAVSVEREQHCVVRIDVKPASVSAAFAGELFAVLPMTRDPAPAAARAILEAHGGTLAFLRDAQRCAVVISLPAA